MFDVLLCDHHLPDGESFDILHGLPEKNPPPLIMMTAFGDRDLASQAFEQYPDEYVFHLRRPKFSSHFLDRQTYLKTTARCIAANKLQRAMHTINKLSANSQT